MPLDEIMIGRALADQLPADEDSRARVRSVDGHTTHVQLDWAGGGASLFLSASDLDVDVAAFATRWILPALEGAVFEAPLLCLSCGTAKRIGADLPCGH
ncbi:MULTISPECIES: hypothetical protein [unclassified Paraburkholderia]|uniref:hypothetical protein n=1 Tax=unclassified Paraburkholderia TaxID=2615204 RepID=UPI002AB1AF9C|nr:MULTISPECIES: hypothetical protein [unclassified Paraburkholderia]